MHLSSWSDWPGPRDSWDFRWSHVTEARKTNCGTKKLRRSWSRHQTFQREEDAQLAGEWSPRAADPAGVGRDLEQHHGDCEGLRGVPEPDQTAGGARGLPLSLHLDYIYLCYVFIVVFIYLFLYYLCEPLFSGSASWSCRPFDPQKLQENGNIAAFE